MSCPALDNYLRDRINLINEDRALRTDHDITRHISSTELRADRVVRAIRSKDAETLWGVEHDDVPHPFPGMEFLTGMHNLIFCIHTCNVLCRKKNHNEEQAI